MRRKNRLSYLMLLALIGSSLLFSGCAKSGGDRETVQQTVDALASPAEEASSAEPVPSAEPVESVRPAEEVVPIQCIREKHSIHSSGQAGSGSTDFEIIHLDEDAAMVYIELDAGLKALAQDQCELYREAYQNALEENKAVQSNAGKQSAVDGKKQSGGSGKEQKAGQKKSGKNTSVSRNKSASDKIFSDRWNKHDNQDDAAALKKKAPQNGLQGETPDDLPDDAGKDVSDDGEGDDEMGKEPPEAPDVGEKGATEAPAKNQKNQKPPKKPGSMEKPEGKSGDGNKVQPPKNGEGKQPPKKGEQPAKGKGANGLSGAAGSFNHTGETLIYRSDSLVLSWSEHQSIRAGSRKTDETLCGYTYDTGTGQPVYLSQVLADTDGLPARLAQQLQKEHPEIVKRGCYAPDQQALDQHKAAYKNQMTLEQYLTEQRDQKLEAEAQYKSGAIKHWAQNAPKGLQWVLVPNAIRFYFTGQEFGGKGILSVDLSYVEKPELFQAAYMSMPENYTFELDKNAASKGQKACMAQAQKKQNAKKLHFQMLHTEEDCDYLYVEADTKNGMQLTYIYRWKAKKSQAVSSKVALSNYHLRKEFVTKEELPEGTLEKERLTRQYPICDPENFPLDRTFDMPIASDSHAMYEADKKGLPKKISDYYHFDDKAINAQGAVQLKKSIKLQPVDRDSFEKEGSPVVVAKNTRLFPYLTDGVGLLVVQDENDQLYRCSIRLSSGRKLVRMNGKPVGALIRW